MVYPDYEACRQNLAELVAETTKAGRNEATTRLHIIDRLFFECLGWNTEDAILEESQAGQYADYTFLFPRRLLIVEAKREGDYFELPHSKDKLVYSIATLLRDIPNLKAAMLQVAGYCQNRGVPYACVCNGHQLVAFVATRTDSQSPFEGKALVFPSLTFMLEHFLDLWQTVSKLAMEEQTLRKRLLGDLQPMLPDKLSAHLSPYPGTKGRNPFQANLQIVSDLILEDLARHPDLEPIFLRECYCNSAELLHHSEITKDFLTARYAALFTSQDPGPTTESITRRDTSISPELLAEAFSRRPILIIGDVGVGKTTFIRHFIRVGAVGVTQNAITLYIDLGSSAALTTDLRMFIIDEMSRQLREQYKVDIEEAAFVRQVYLKELVRFGQGVYSALKSQNLRAYQEKELEFLAGKVATREQHLKASCEFLSHHRKQQILIFLDNTDQRSEEFQQLAFLIAQELAERWPATVFVALRPETFHSSYRRGALTGYHPKAFTVSPPRIHDVIFKRFGFGLKITSGKIPLPSSNQKVSVRLFALDAVIRAFLLGLGRDENLNKCIEHISGGNVRLALDMIRQFFGSGHVDTEKIVDIYKATKHYYVSLHEFLRAVIYGDAEHYDPARSNVANLFDVSTSDAREHFLMPFLLGLLSAKAVEASDEGFVETATVYRALQALGYLPEQIDVAVLRAYRHKLIQTAARRIPDPGKAMPHSLRLTSVGEYHHHDLSNTFSYIDAVIVDTPVFDKRYRERIRAATSIRDRIARSEIFCEYLDSIWLKSADGAPWFNWEETAKVLRGERAIILHKAADRERKTYGSEHHRPR
jgi:hypothetical protein